MSKLTDDEFFTLLFQEHYQQIRHYVLHLSRLPSSNPLIDDITQETFYVAYKKIKRIREHENIIGWLHVTAHLIYKHDLSSDKYKYIPIDEVPEPEARSDHYIEYLELFDDLKGHLSESEMLLLCDYYVCGYNSDILSKTYHKSSAAIQQQVYRLKKKLNNIFKFVLLFSHFSAYRR